MFFKKRDKEGKEKGIYLDPFLLQIKITKMINFNQKVLICFKMTIFIFLSFNLSSGQNDYLSNYESEKGMQHMVTILSLEKHYIPKCFILL